MMCSSYEVNVKWDDVFYIITKKDVSIYNRHYNFLKWEER